eukprot:gb/GECH01012728.1/.p1 GENE.gb/GECH01012728.1/~~gb/GECH01012728.1/.p1  ORF type:complete len:261 (+),score=62.59 gb/GECH01012728.1/:1-783(+)
MVQRRALIHGPAGLSSILVSKAVLVTPIQNFRYVSQLHSAFSLFDSENRLRNEDLKELLKQGHATEFSLATSKFFLEILSNTVLKTKMPSEYSGACASSVAALITYPLYASRVDMVNNIISVQPSNIKQPLFNMRLALISAVKAALFFALQQFLQQSFQNGLNQNETLDGWLKEKLSIAAASACSAMVLNPLERFLNLSIANPHHIESFPQYVLSTVKREGVPALFRGALWHIPEAVISVFSSSLVYKGLTQGLDSVVPQ